MVVFTALESDVTLSSLTVEYFKVTVVDVVIDALLKSLVSCPKEVILALVYLGDTSRLLLAHLKNKQKLCSDFLTSSWTIKDFQLKMQCIEHKFNTYKQLAFFCARTRKRFKRNALNIVSRI